MTEEQLRDLLKAIKSSTLFSETAARLWVAREFGIDLLATWTERGLQLTDECAAAVDGAAGRYITREPYGQKDDVSWQMKIARRDRL